MTYLKRLTQKPTYQYAAVSAGLSPDAGQPQSNKLQTTCQTHYLDVVIEGDLIITSTVTSFKNRGSILAAFDYLAINENGAYRWKGDARMLRYFAETVSQSALTATRASTLTASTQHLKECFRIYFAHPYQLSPRETAFLVRDPKTSLTLEHQLNGTANGVGRIITGGAATLQNVKVSVQQKMDEYEKERPYFIPTMRQMEFVVTADQTQMEAPIVNSKYLRGALIQQDTNVGEVSDIIRNFVLKGDARSIIGPEMVAFDQFARDREAEYGGAVYVPGYAYINFQEHGRLTHVWNPAQDNNLKFVFDCLPSATSGATISTIRVMLFELERDPGMTTPDGKPLVAPLDIQV